MTYYLYKLLQFLGITFPFAGVISIALGIFIEGGKTEPWGELAVLFLAVGACSLIAFTWWADEGDIPEKPIRLSRDGKKQLRAEQDRVILQRSIERMEREELGE